MLLHTLIGNISLGMNIKYVPAAHHEKMGRHFPEQPRHKGHSKVVDVEFEGVRV